MANKSPLPAPAQPAAPARLGARPNVALVIVLALRGTTAHTTPDKKGRPRREWGSSAQTDAMERLQAVKAGLQRAHCPAVMVLAHPSVEAACTQRNGLSLAELLRPYGVIRQLNGTVGGEERE